MTASSGPKFWKQETDGKLGVAVLRYLRQEPLTIRDLRLIRLYLQRYASSPVWEMPPRGIQPDLHRLQQLRKDVLRLFTVEALDQWIAEAVPFGMSPL